MAHLITIMKLEFGIMKERLNMNASKVEQQLEEWENIAYSQSWGADWLETVGEGFKFYAGGCAYDGLRMSISGFMDWLKQKAPVKDSEYNALLVSETPEEAEETLKEYRKSTEEFREMMGGK